MPKKLKTYVEFIRPDWKIPAGAATVVEVDSRDIRKLDIPAKCEIFYFYDSPIESGNIYDTQNEQYNVSRFHIVAERLLTRDEAREMLEPHYKNNPAAKAVWDVRLGQHDVFALTRNNNIEPVRKDSIVIDAQKNRLFPKPAPDPLPDFKMAVERPVHRPPTAKFPHKKGRKPAP